MRDDQFYRKLGFEHGYAGQEPAYADLDAYARGHGEGVAFRRIVGSLAPDFDWNGDRATVTFRYVSLVRLSGKPDPDKESAG